MKDATRVRILRVTVLSIMSMAFGATVMLAFDLRQLNTQVESLRAEHHAMAVKMHAQVEEMNEEVRLLNIKAEACQPPHE